MNGLPYYKRYPRDFLEGTIGMPFELKGAYSVLLDLIYVQSGALPDDPHYIAGALGCSVRKWNKVRSDLIEMGKIKAENGIISNLRADKEQIILRTYQDKQRENRLGSNKNKDLQKPRSNQTITIQNQNHNNTPKPPEGAFEEFWECFPHRHGRKENRKGAEQKFKAAVKKGVDPSEIINAAKQYAQADQVKRGYGRGPVPWLNQEGWADEITSQQSSEEMDRYQAIIERNKRIA